MAIFDWFNAAFGYGNIPSSSFVRTGAISQTPNQRNQGQPKVPSFGLKMAPSLDSDTFVRSTDGQQAQGQQAQGQKMVSYKGKKMSLEQARTDSFKEVDAHEQAHLSAAGQYASGGKVIDFDGNGIAVSGHVNIKMPHLDKNNPEETIKHAKQVMVAAKAPESFSELSDADLNVYAQASATLAKAEAFKAQQGKNPFATNPFANRA